MIRQLNYLKPLILTLPDITTNPCVGGSNPLGRANEIKGLAKLLTLFISP
jgi:hypothetical protein